MEYKVARKRKIFLFATRISIQLEGIEHFSRESNPGRKKTADAHLHIFYRHTRIDHQRFFHLSISLFFCLPTRFVSLYPVRRNEKMKKREWEKDEEWWSNEYRWCKSRGRIRGSLRLAISYIASHCFWHRRFIFAATRPTTFSVDWAHCPWDRD